MPSNWPEYQWAQVRPYDAITCTLDYFGDFTFVCIPEHRDEFWIWDEDQFRWRRKRRHRKLWQFECIFCGCLVNIKTGGKAKASDGRFNHRTCWRHVLTSKQLGRLASSEAIADRRRQAFEQLREEVLAQRDERLMTALRAYGQNQ